MTTCTTCGTEFDGALAACPECGTAAPVDMGGHEHTAATEDTGLVADPAVSTGAVDSTATVPATGSPDANDKNLAMLAHASAASALIGLPVVGPLVMWLVYKDKGGFVAANAVEALNFNISYAIWSALAGISLVLLIGFILLPLVTIAWIVLAIIGAIKASEGEVYRYPLTLRLVK